MPSFHAGLLAWNLPSLKSSAQSIAKSFGGCRLLACCERGKEKEVEGILEGAGRKSIFSPPAFDSAVGMGSAGRENSIGHARNTLLLASLCLDGKAGIALLDDDILPGASAHEAFGRAFEKYDLVQGAYTGGYSGNKIYSLVYFFDMLSELAASKSPELEARVEKALFGAVPVPQASGQAKLAATTGGLVGISGALKARNHFAPTPYPFDDHFFEFSSRFLFPSMRFMGENTQPSDIPSASHNMADGASQSRLVDNFIREVRASIVEKYFYFRLSGSLPMLKDGRHVLVKAESFGDEAAAAAAMQEAALPKFQPAAEFYQSRLQGGELGRQLERIAALSIRDFIVPQGELEAEWGHYESERAWFSRASEQCRLRGKEVAGALFA